MMKLFGMPLSPRVNRVRFLLNILKQEYEFCYVDLFIGEARTETYAQMSMNSKVPCLKDDDFALSESNSIMRYLACKFESELYPKPLKERVVVDQWLDFINSHLDEPMGRILFNKFVAPKVGVHPSERAIKEAGFLISYHLPVVERHLSKTRFVASEKLTIADLCLLSVLDTFEVLDVSLSDYPNTEKWQKMLMKEVFYTDCYTSYTDLFKDSIA